jgi:putative heme-binding domain-containing protein
MAKRRTVLMLSLLLFWGLMPQGLLQAHGAEIEKGKQFYEEKKCGLCHAVSGKGGKLGPDLSEEGGKRDRDWLMKFLKNPKEVVPGAKMPSVKGSDEEISSLTDYLLSLKK